MYEWSKTLPGFGIRIGKSRRTFAVKYRVCGIEVEESIAPCSLMTAEVAEEIARESIELARQGVDPRRVIVPSSRRSTTRITNAFVESLLAPDPSGKQKLYWDVDLRGFGVLVSGVTNSKSYIVQRRMPDGNGDRRRTVGTVAEISTDDAREIAADWLFSMRHGDLPVKRRGRPRTLKAIFIDYVRGRERIGSISPETSMEYSRNLERNFADWKDLPLAIISRAMVERRKVEIRERVEASGRASNPDASIKSAMTLLGTLWNFEEARYPGSFPRSPVLREYRPQNRRQKTCPVDGTLHQRIKATCSEECHAIYEALQRRRAEAEQRRRREKQDKDRRYRQRTGAILRAAREMGIIEPADLAVEEMERC